MIECYDTYFVAFTDCTDTDAVAAACRLCADEFDRAGEGVATLALSPPYESLRGIAACFHSVKYLVRNKLFWTVTCVLTSDGTVKKYRQSVKDAVGYICKHYSENITIKSVADALYVSDSHLMHLFKEDLGKTFNEWLTEYRIREAKRLLKTGKYRIYEVAEAVGYSDVKYFGQVFRKLVGCMPSEYAGDRK